jgi:hypothetical protein
MWRSGKPGWLFVALLAVVAALLSPGLLVGPSLDASVFMVVGWRLTEGAVTYLDVRDNKTARI